MTRSLQHVYRHALHRQPINPMPALNGNVLAPTSQYHTYRRSPSSHAQFTPLRTTLPSSLSPFSTTSAFLKKKDKHSSKSESSAGAGAGAAADASSEDPFNFSSLQEGITDAVAKLKDELSKLRAGGRFNPETIEGLKVTVPKGGSPGEKESLRLGALAQVVPKGGRAVMVLVGEEEHVKHVTTAIQSSNFTPQADPHNPLQLIVPIPPPTQESRDKAVLDARAAMDKAANSVKNSRAAQQKRLRDMKLKKTVRPDDLKKAGDQMEKVAEKGQKEVKDVFEGVKKVLEQR